MPSSLPWAEDVLQLRVAEVEPIAVLRRPAARAVQAAGGGGVDEHRPGDVAVVLAAQLVVPLALQERAVPGEVLKERAPRAGVDVVPEAQDEAVPVVVRVRQAPPGCPGSPRPCRSPRVLDHVVGYGPQARGPARAMQPS